MSVTIYETTAGLGAEGPNGNVTPQRVLEWMQDAAANASFLGGYPPDRYRAMNAGWFVKEIVLAIDRPIVYRDAIRIETWVSDLRRFRSHREYRLYANGELAARAQTDWLLLERDISSGRVRPLRPDAEMLAAFPLKNELAIADGATDALEWSEPSAPDGEHKMERVVLPSELDRHEHVNHVVYLAWVEDHARTFFGPRSELKKIRIEYEADAKNGDPIAIQGWAQGDRIRHRATRNGQVVLKTTSLRVF